MEFVDKEDVFYQITSPLTAEDLIISNTDIPNLKYAITKTCVEEMAIYVLDSKEAKVWNTHFPIWKNLYHPNYNGIHNFFKKGNETYFIQDKKSISFPDLIEKFIEAKKEKKLNESFEIFLNSNKQYTYNENFIKKIAFSVLNFLSYLHKQGTFKIFFFFF